MASEDETRELVESGGGAHPLGNRPAGLPAPREPGARIARYEIESVLGAGGMGVVYAAHDTALGRRVALKLLHPGSGDGDGSTRLLREAQALAKLSHPNVVTVFDVGAAGDEVYIALELVDGTSLAAWRRDTAPSPARVLEVLRAAGRGLAAAHAAGVIHRDVKPANVLVGADGSVRVTDFGLARPVDDGATPAERGDVLATELTETGAVVGTPAYMAPEQIDGGAVTPAADQFSFCVTAFELLVGTRPFAGGTLTELRAAIERQDLRAPGRATIDGRVLAAITRGLRAVPDQRHPSMDALLAALAPRRRTPWIAAAAAGALVAAGAAAVLVTSNEAPAARSCAPDARAVDAVWSPTRAAQVRAAIAATGVPYAARVTDNAIAALDRWASETRTLRVATCEAGGRGDLAPAVVTARRHCLDEQAIDADVRIEALLAADRGNVEHSVNLARPQPPSACATVEVVAAAQDPDLPPATATALRRAIARGRVLRLQRKHDESVPVLRTALRDAEAAGALALATEARTALAQAVLVSEGDGGASEPVARETLELARQAAEDATVLGRSVDAALAWQTVVAAKGRLGEGDGAEEATRASRAAAGRTGNPTLEVSALRHNGSLLGSVNRQPEAFPVLAEAEALATRALAADDPEHLSIQMKYAALMLPLGRYTEALDRLERAAAASERVYGAEHPVTAFVVSTQAAALARLGRTDEAIPLERRAAAITRAAYPDDARPVTDSIQSLGHTLMESRDAAVRREGLAALVDALARVERNEGPETARAGLFVVAVATAQATLGDREAAFANFARGTAIAEKTAGAGGTAARYQLLAAYTNWGMELVGAGRCAEAMPLFRRALEVAASDSQRLPGVSNLAGCLVELGQPAEAVAAIEPLAARIDRAELSPHARADLDETLGFALAGVGRRREARALMLRARPLYLEAGFAPDDPIVKRLDARLAKLR